MRLGVGWARLVGTDGRKNDIGLRALSRELRHRRQAHRHHHRRVRLSTGRCLARKTVTRESEMSPTNHNRQPTTTDRPTNQRKTPKKTKKKQAATAMFCCYPSSSGVRPVRPVQIASWRPPLLPIASCCWAVRCPWKLVCALLPAPFFALGARGGGGKQPADIEQHHHQCSRAARCSSQPAPEVERETLATPIHSTRSGRIWAWRCAATVRLETGQPPGLPPTD